MRYVADGHGNASVFLVLLLGGSIDLLAEPIAGSDAVALREVFAALAPPHAFAPVVIDENLVGEDGPPFAVLHFGLGIAQRFHEHLIGEVAHALGDAEHASLDVVHVKSTIALLGGAANNVVAEREDLVLGHGTLCDTGGDIGLPTHAREGGTEVNAAVAVVDAEQCHVLNDLDPDVLVGLRFFLRVFKRLDADQSQTEYFLGSKCISTVIAIDGAAVEFLREVGNPPIFLAEGPIAVGDPRKACLLFEDTPAIVEIAHPVEVADNVGAIGQLDAAGGELAVGGIGDKRHHIHGASLHHPVKELVELAVHLLGIHPEVQRACIDGVVGANDRTFLDAGDIVFVTSGVEASLSVDILVEAGIGTGCLQLVLESDDLIHFAGNDLDRVGFAQVCFLSDPILHVFRE